MITSSLSPEEFHRAFDTVSTALREVADPDPRLVRDLEKSRGDLVTAEKELKADKRVGPAWKIANAAKHAGKHYTEVDPTRARMLFELAVPFYKFHQSERYVGSIEECSTGLAQLDSVLPDRDGDPVADEPGAKPETSAEPALDGIPRQPGGPLSAHQPAADPFDRWRSDEPWEKSFAQRLDEFEAHLRGLVTTHAPAPAELLQPLIVADLRMLRDGLDGVRVPADEYSPLHQGAMTARFQARTAFGRYVKGGTASEAQWTRIQFLRSALLNFCLCFHLKSNNYQFVADVVGYLQTIQAEHRRNSGQRELLLAATEATTLVAVSELQDVDLELRLAYVCGWLRHAVGIQLLIGGSNPADAEYSKYDPRVRDVDAEDWATHLLDQWVDKPEHWHSTAFVLLGLSAWKEERLERLLTGLYHRPYGVLPARAVDVRRFWRRQAVDLLERVRDVSVVQNAWERGVPSETADLMSLAEHDQVVRLPTRLLQGMAAELTSRPGGLMVQGALFAGRRVPTFLTRDVFGPVGVLKIDEASKVQREKRNFDEFGELLPPFYRSSKCTVSSTTIVNRTNGSRHQAILTSYVFRESDEPSTFRDWLLRSNSVGEERLGGVIDKLFVKALGPWLSNASRTVGDLRGEYPALRPAGFERAGYRPGKNAQSELRKFESPEAGAVFGVQDGLTWRLRTLGELLGDPTLVGGTASDKERTNPLWLVAHIADVARPAPECTRLFDWLLNDKNHGLTTRYLTCVSHGDLHCSNILVSGPDADDPHLYVIDFETTHRGHIAKDFARLEAALWSRTFVWSPEQVGLIRQWFAESLHGDSLWSPVLPEAADDRTRRILACVVRLRGILKACEQANWAFNELEYQWALFASLVPFARYRDHEAEVNRRLPFFLAADVAEALVTRAMRTTEATAGMAAR
ncbi:phosphotransferase [Streptomyces sp. NPDC059787]|uniref:phosphotransferase n=1 Tax=Streptomyces sp. NPDC059787 TaxID=3346947 RepID=UPI00365EFF39